MSKYNYTLLRYDSTPIVSILSENGVRINTALSRCIKKGYHYNVTIGEVAEYILQNKGRFNCLAEIKNLGYTLYGNLSPALKNYWDNKDINLDVLQNEFFIEINKLSNEHFVKDSEKLTHVQERVEAFLNDVSKEYLKTHSEEETSNYIKTLIEKYHNIVDEKRSLSAISRIIKQGVKYKHNINEPKGRIHKHNKFADDNLNPNL